MIIVRIHITHIASGRPAPVIVCTGGLFRLVVIIEACTLTTEINSANFTLGHFVAIIIDNMQFAHQGRAHRALVGQPIGRINYR